MPLAKCVREESVDAEHPPPTTPRAVTSAAADPSPGVEQTKEAAPPRRVLVVPLPAGRRKHRRVQKRSLLAEARHR
jgi:hypothetical protein